MGFQESRVIERVQETIQIGVFLSVWEGVEHFQEGDEVLGLVGRLLLQRVSQSPDVGADPTLFESLLKFCHFLVIGHLLESVDVLLSFFIGFQVDVCLGQSVVGLGVTGVHLLTPLIGLDCILVAGLLLVTDAYVQV